jgi:hypothetical protein
MLQDHFWNFKLFGIVGNDDNFFGKIKVQLLNKRSI